MQAPIFKCKFHVELNPFPGELTKFPVNFMYMRSITWFTIVKGDGWYSEEENHHS
jgi:hypothetical protein